MNERPIVLQVHTGDNDNINDAVDKDLSYHALKKMDEEKFI